jgi:hypothetical protein
MSLDFGIAGVHVYKKDDAGLLQIILEPSNI